MIVIVLHAAFDLLNHLNPASNDEFYRVLNARIEWVPTSLILRVFRQWLL